MSKVSICGGKYTLINFPSPNQHSPTFNQNQHLDVQHQDTQADKYRDQQSKRESAFNLIEKNVINDFFSMTSFFF